MFTARTLLSLALSVLTASAAAMVPHGRDFAIEGANKLAKFPVVFVPGAFEDDSDSYDSFEDLESNPDTDDVLYDHMPKAGGTFLIKLFRQAVPKEHFQIRSEFENLTQQDTDTTFVIGSVRSPCDYYVSLWSYGVEHGGAMMSTIPEEDKWVYNATSENKSSDEDIRLFRAWVKMMDVADSPGIMSVRFAQSYAVLDKPLIGKMPPFLLSPELLQAVADAMETNESRQRVDCWVKLEDVDGTARGCLHDWHKKTGIEIDWDAFDEVMASGDDPIKSSSHGSCSSYFDIETEAIVRTTEHRIFELFDYQECCA